MTFKSLIIKTNDLEIDIEDVLKESKNCRDVGTISEELNSKIYLIKYLNTVTISILKNYKLTQLINDNINGKIDISEVMIGAFSKELENNPYHFTD